MAITGPHARSAFNLEAAYQKAFADLVRRNPEDVAQKSGAVWNRDLQCFRLTFLGQGYTIPLAAGETEKGWGGAVSLTVKILLLHYLKQAGGIPLANRWVSFKELPGGSIYIGPYHQRAIVPLVKTFGHRPEIMVKSGEALGGNACDFGDASVAVTVLPRVPLALVLWSGDDEFPPAGNFLYDESVSSYLPTEDCAVLPGLIIGRLKELAEG